MPFRPRDHGGPPLDISVTATFKQDLSSVQHVGPDKRLSAAGHAVAACAGAGELAQVASCYCKSRASIRGAPRLLLWAAYGNDQSLSQLRYCIATNHASVADARNDPEKQLEVSQSEQNEREHAA